MSGIPKGVENTGPTNSKNKPLIEIKNLTKVFGKRKVLNNISFELKQGEFLTIFGPNGVGKTTLIRLLSTAVSPTKGEILVDGFSLTKNPIQVKQKIGVISHNPFLYNDLNAYENLRFYGQMYQVSSLKEKIAHLLEIVELEHRRYDVVRTFSQGMRQRLSIARALIHEPSILLLDEPHSGLDPHASEVLDNILRDLGKKNHTFLMTTHNLNKGLEMANSVIILSERGIVFRQQKDKIDSSKVKEIYLQHVREPQ